MPVTVPGQIAGWAEMLRRFGKLSLAEVLRPAIEYAGGGYPVSPIVSQNWHKAFGLYQKELHGEQFRHWFETFAPAGHAPHSGEIFHLPDMAATLRQLAHTQGESFTGAS